MRACKRLFEGTLFLISVFLSSHLAAENLSKQEQALEQSPENHLLRAKYVQALVANGSCSKARRNVDVIVAADSVPLAVKENLQYLLNRCADRKDSALILLVKPRVGYDTRPTSFSQDFGFAGFLGVGLEFGELVDLARPSLVVEDVLLNQPGDAASECPDSVCNRNQSDSYKSLSVGLVYSHQFNLMGRYDSQITVRNKAFRRSYDEQSYFDFKSAQSGFSLNTHLNENYSLILGGNWRKQSSSSDIEFDSLRRYMGLQWEGSQLQASLRFERVRRDYQNHLSIDWSENDSAILMLRYSWRDIGRFNGHYKYSKNSASIACLVCPVVFDQEDFTSDVLLSYKSHSYGVEFQRQLGRNYKVKLGVRRIDYSGLTSSIENYNRVSLGFSRDLIDNLDLEFSYRSERYGASFSRVEDRNVYALGLNWVWDG